jgi:hypothetical protein
MKLPPSAIAIASTLLLVPAMALAAPPQLPGPPLPVRPPRPPVAEHPSPAPLPTISLDEVRAGQRGYGLSVFAGDNPERFDVEVMGVMRNVSPDTSYILARLTGKDLEKSGVIAGMSGSPVFLDGRLAGAVAFSWPFSREAIAGITPIESMRRISGVQPIQAPNPVPPQAPPLPPVGLSDLAAGKVPPDLLERQLEAFKPHFAGGGVAALQWSTIGFGERSSAMLKAALGNVAPAGRAAATGTIPAAPQPATLVGHAPGPPNPAKLVPGGSVAAVLVDGDFSLAATGTVTDRIGDQVFAFGHPFLGLGPTRVPMATADVVTVLASQYSSFKIANIGDVVGAFEQDRQVGIEGRLGLKAPMVPMTLEIRGPQAHTFHMRLADVPQLMPLLVGSSLTAGLESASYASGPQGLDLWAKLSLAGHGDVVFEQSFDGDTAGAETASYVIALAGYLTQNPLERVRLESIDVRLTQSATPRSSTLVDAHADRAVVRPGDKVTLNLDLLPYRGEPYRHTTSVTLPEDLPDGHYSLLVGDGASADASRLLLQPAEPLSFHQALALLRSFHSRRDLVVMGVFGGAGLSVAGEAMPRLPASVRSLWGAAASGSAVPLRMAIAQQQVERLARPIDGLVKIDLEVRRREPLPAGATETPGAKPSDQPPNPADAKPAAGTVVAAGEVAAGGPEGVR